MADGEAQRLEEILAARYDEMVGRARRLLGSEMDARDAVQEAVLSILSGPHLLGAVEQIGAWLYTLVYRRSVDIIRRESKRRQKEAESAILDLFEGGDPEELMQRDELAGAVAKAVRELPEDLRSAFVLNGLEDMTFEEMSRQSGVPMGTLMARKKKAVDLIRNQLRQQGFLK
jgi:RNA polymerase sigma factor (sigma-70 family)